MGIGALAFFILLALIGRLALPRARDLRIVFSEGIFHMAAPIGLMNLALLSVDAGKSAILSFTTTLWVVPFAVLVLGERPSVGKLIGLALGLVGIAVLFNPTAMDWNSTNSIIGHLLLMLAAMTWAFAILVARTQIWNLTPLQLVPWQLLLSTVILLILALIFERVGDIRWSLELGAILAFNGIVASGFCFWGALVVAKELPSIDASIGFLGVPVAGVIFSAAFLGEPLTVSLVSGLVLIVGGIAFVNLTEAKSAEKVPQSSSNAIDDDSP
jgi:drug/metabolite transporter (DMT)-like permease